MLRICGVTFDHTTNYGSNFQAYALQTTIEKMCIKGQDCHYDLLPLSQMNIRNKQHNFVRINFLHRTKEYVIKTAYIYRRKKFYLFEKARMHFANCVKREQLPLLNHIYDAYICGSDVIWNLNFTKGDDAYFLEFTDKYKFSYAASFGVADIYHDFGYSEEEIKRMFSGKLESFNSISVREKSAESIVYKLTGKKPQVVCDPVLLLSVDEWEKISNKNKIKYKYIFAYSTYISPNFLLFIKKLKQQTGLKVIHITWDIKEAINRKILRWSSPEEWLTLLIHAEYVVTNSFHAVAFSTLFHKRFFAIMRDEQIIGTRIRLYDYLRLIGKQDRIMGIIPEKIDLSYPDYSYSDQVLTEMKEQAISYIKTNLEKALGIKEQGTLRQLEDRDIC